MQKLLFSVISGILLFGIIGNSQLVYGEKLDIDENDFELTGAVSEIFSYEFFPGAYAGTGDTGMTGMTGITGVAIGGDISPLDTTSLLLINAQQNAIWLIPVIAAVIGIAIVIARKF